MHFPMRIQPLELIPNDTGLKPAPVMKSRLKRLFDRPFNSVLKISTAEKPIPATDFEPSSICLDKMVQNFIEDNSNDKHYSCNCFKGNRNDSSDDELDFFSDSFSATKSSFPDHFDNLKSLVPCKSQMERNLLKDTTKIFEKNNKLHKRKEDLRKIVTEGLIANGYNASVCKSEWEKSSSMPSGEYEYIDMIIEGERFLIDIDFRSEFEIARSTNTYKAILQSLPQIFVGKADRLLQIVSIVSEAARQSIKKKGMYLPPWRKSEYMKSKWLAGHTRISADKSSVVEEETKVKIEIAGVLECFGEKMESLGNSPSVMWQPPAVRPKSLEKGSKGMVTGLAFLLREV